MAFNPFVHLDIQEYCGKDGKTHCVPVDDDLDPKEVLHCGNCGLCSNTYDLDLLKKKSETLTSTSTLCAVSYWLFGVTAAELCMDKVGFTSPCQGCWVENIKCSVKECREPCLRSFFIRLIKGDLNGIRDKDDPCISCDEIKCGPSFAKCAGANRRRCGFKSDIIRDEDDLCLIANCSVA